MNATYYFDFGLFNVLEGLLYGFNGFAGMTLSIACYVLWSLGIYTIAKRRGIRKAWLAWVPVLRIWQLGCISDQYQYVVRGKVKSKRKSLVILSVLQFLLICCVVISALVAFVNLIGGIMYKHDVLYNCMVGAIQSLAGVIIALMVISIAQAVIRFMALYDLYASCCPQYDVLFLLLSIFFKPTTAFFIFFNRNKDEGMPPRRDEPAYHRTVEEPWDN